MERNTIEIDVDGRKIGFKCGNLAIAIACREAEAPTVDDLLNMMAAFDLKANLALLYGSYCQFNNVKAPEFTMSMMSDISEKITDEQADQVSTILLETFIPKNAQAPAQNGASQ